MAIESATVRLLAFVNEELLAGTCLRADEETPLFDQGWIDSLKILKLIAYVETLTGREIPDELIVMKNFRSVSIIAQTFAGGPR